MNTNYNHLYIAVAGLAVAVIILNILRSYLRKQNRQIDDASSIALDSNKQSAVSEPENNLANDTQPIQQNLNIELPKEQIQEHNQEQAATATQSTIAAKKQDLAHDDLVMISIHAPAGKNFGDYNFLQTLGSAGLSYGDQQIFHYDVKTEHGDKRLFSVAKLNKPGTFDLDNIDSIDCQGLLLFINLQCCDRIHLALDCMLEIATNLAEDLEGVLYSGYNIPWDTAALTAIKQKVEAYPRTKQQANFLTVDCVS